MPRRTCAIHGRREWERTIHVNCRGDAVLNIFVLALVLGLQPLARADNTKLSDDEAYLDQLQGDWDMTGRVLGKPVRHHARGERVPGGDFLRLHRTDAQAPPPYEADVFIGFDRHAGDYV